MTQTVRWAAEAVDTPTPTIPVGVISNPESRTLPVVAFGPTTAQQQQVVGADLLVIPSEDPVQVVEYVIVLAGAQMKIRLWIKEILEDGRLV